jgi:hypothetical protein
LRTKRNERANFSPPGAISRETRSLRWSQIVRHAIESNRPDSRKPGLQMRTSRQLETRTNPEATLTVVDRGGCSVRLLILSLAGCERVVSGSSFEKGLLCPT